MNQHDIELDREVIEAEQEAFLESDDTWDVTFSELSPPEVLLLHHGFAAGQKWAIREGKPALAKRYKELHEELGEEVPPFGTINAKLEQLAEAEAEADPDPEPDMNTWRGRLHEWARAPVSMAGTAFGQPWTTVDKVWATALALVVMQFLAAVADVATVTAGQSAAITDAVQAIVAVGAAAGFAFTIGWAVARRGVEA